MENHLPIPITLLSGYLGSGKTTLLNHILHADHGMRVAVLVNDFGSVNIDAELVVGVEGEKSVTLSNGCICCTIRGDLLKAVLELVQSDDRPEYIIIEASGVSDPAAVATTFILPELAPYVTLDSIIAVLDAEQFGSLEGFEQILAMDQVGVADFVLLNKTDLVSGEALDEVKAWVREVVPNARVFETTYAKVPLELLLGVGRYDEGQLLHREAHDVHVHTPTEVGVQHSFVMNPDLSGHQHDDHTQVFHTWTFRSDQPFEVKLFRKLLDQLPASIYRAKGFVYSKEVAQKKLVLQVVGRRISLKIGDPWGQDPVETRIVFIGREGEVNVSKLRQGLEACLATEASLESNVGRVMEWVRSDSKQSASSPE